MGNRRSHKQKGNQILVMLWGLTAVAVIIVMFVYFGRLDKIQRELNSIAIPNNVGAADGKTKPMADDETIGVAAGDEATGMAAGDEMTGVAAADETTGVSAADETTGMAAGDETSEVAATDKATDVAVDEETFETSAAVVAGNKSAQVDNKLDPDRKIIAITFDDGPSIYTERILEALAKNGAKATFFMVGYNVEKQPERVKMVYEAGCEVANHTEDHKSLTEGTAEEIINRIAINEKRIKGIVPVERVLVRPPYGSYNDTTREIVDRPMINWSVDSLDWKTRDADSIVKEIKANAQDGYIILMHDIYKSTAEAVEKILPWLVSEGYQVTTVSAMYEARGEELAGGHVYRFTYKAGAKH